MYPVIRLTFHLSHRDGWRKKETTIIKLLGVLDQEAEILLDEDHFVKVVP